MCRIRMLRVLGAASVLSEQNRVRVHPTCQGCLSCSLEKCILLERDYAPVHAHALLVVWVIPII